MSEILIEPPASDWQVSSLGELCRAGLGDIQTGPFGSQLHAYDYVPVGMPSVMPQNIGDNLIVEDGIARITAEDAARLSRYLLDDGDIVYSRRGDVERRALVRPEQAGWLCGTGCLRVRLGTSADPRFMSYYLGHPDVREWIVRHAIGATMLNLNTGILSSVPVTLPPRPVQLAIGKILGAIDDKIAMNDRIEHKAHELARMRFADSIHDASRKVVLRDIIDLNYGKALPEGHREVGRVPVFGSNGRSGWHSQSLSPGPGIVIGRKGANAGSVSWCQGPFWVIDTAFFVDKVAEGIPLEYLYFLMQEAGLRSQVGDSAIPGLNREIALACTYMLPSESVICSVASGLRALLALRAHVPDESASLVKLRDTLLPKLMSGAIRVHEAERIVEDAT